MQSLPPELVNHVLSFLSPPDLKSARFVSPSINAVATARLFHTMRVDPRTNGVELKTYLAAQRISHYSDLLRFVKRLEITRLPYAGGPDYLKFLLALQYCNELSVSLSEWSQYCTPLFFELLPSFSLSKLNVFELDLNFCSSGFQTTDFPSVRRIANDLKASLECVTHLDMRFSRFNSDEWDEKCVRITTLLSTMSKLRSLHLDEYNSEFFSARAEENRAKTTGEFLKPTNWETLHSLSLSKLTSTAPILIAFLETHRQNLKEFTISNVSIIEDRKMVQQDGWLEIFHYLHTHLQLEKFRIDGRLGENFPKGIDWEPYRYTRYSTELTRINYCGRRCGRPNSYLLFALEEYVLNRRACPLPDRAIITKSLKPPSKAWGFNGHKCLGRTQCGDRSFRGSRSRVF